jgi:Na+/proline symporter
MSEFIIIGGMAVAINFIFIKYKLEHGRMFDGVLDSMTLVVLSMLFAGTAGGAALGMVAGALVSLYLWFSPPKVPNVKKNVTKYVKSKIDINKLKEAGIINRDQNKEGVHYVSESYKSRYA